MPKDSVKIVQQGTIRDPWDFIGLDIVAWDRPHGFWSNPADAMKAVSSWFIGHARYTVVQVDLRSAPHRNDWPEWTHTGFHGMLGHLFWNAFHASHVGELYFADEPDFFGRITHPREIHFWGDIGKVSPTALAIAQKKMAAHDLWISVIDTQKQVIIEPYINLRDTWTGMLLGDDARGVSA